MIYPRLFSKGRIGRLTLKNRIVMSPMGTQLANLNGEASDHIIRYYEERARGGVGLIITEITRVDELEGRTLPRQLSASDIKYKAELSRLADTVHKYDCKIFLQLQHAGRRTLRAITGLGPVGASDIPDARMPEGPRPLTTAEVKEMIQRFIHAAVIAQGAGIDGIELHGAHGYLIQQFLSPAVNNRTDEYGSSEENRMRFLIEILTGIKKTCGPAFPVSVRLSAVEYMEGGIELDYTVRIAKALEKAGADALNISCGGGPTSGVKVMEPYSYAQGWKKGFAQKVKKNVSIPVIAVNTIKLPDFAESLLEEGVSDFIGLGRALLADPEWPVKAYNGRDMEIRNCIGCMYCFNQMHGFLRHIRCAVNARTGREIEFGTLNINGNGRVVAVIGGGPAGMEAARVLALRGFKPVIFEKGPMLGGNLNVADKPPFKEKLTWMVEHMTRQLEVLGVSVLLNTEATIEKVKEISPVGVFVAVGATPIVPSLPGIDKAEIAEDVILNKVTTGDKVAVIGSGMTGCETVEVLAEMGKSVTLIEMLPEIGPGMVPHVMQDLKERFEKYELNILTSHQLLAVEDDGVIVKSLEQNKEMKIACDTAVLALGVRPRNDVMELFENNFDNVFAVGDVYKAGPVAGAISDGFARAFVFDPMR